MAYGLTVGVREAWRWADVDSACEQEKLEARKMLDCQGGEGVHALLDLVGWILVFIGDSG